MPPRPSLLAAAALLFAGLALPGVASAGDDPYGDIAPKKETTRLAVAPADGGDLLQLLQPIRFTTGSTTIATISTLVIQDVAAVLKDHAEWTKVEIGGHTDSVGSAEKNLELSQGRVQVVHLVEPLEQLAGYEIHDVIGDVGPGHQRRMAAEAGHVVGQAVGIAGDVVDL